MHVLDFVYTGKWPGAETDIAPAAPRYGSSGSLKEGGPPLQRSRIAADIPSAQRGVVHMSTTWRAATSSAVGVEQLGVEGGRGE